MSSARYAEFMTAGAHSGEVASSGVAGERAVSIVHELMLDRKDYLAFVRARVRSGADAEDILQQALVKAAEHADVLRNPERARAWFFQILRRTVADHRARWAVRESKLETLAADLEEATPEEVATCACSLGQLERIDSKYPDILRRMDLEDQTLSEAAEALAISVNNATVRLHRARKALRDKLFEFCGTDSVRACADCSCDV